MRHLYLYVLMIIHVCVDMLIRTRIPHFVVASKSSQAAYNLQVHVVGVLVHGRGINGRQPYVYTCLENIANDSNLTIEVIYRTLVHIESKSLKPLPKTLYLQLDNCTGSNKNK